jgi:hypothetical protein
MSSLWEKLPDHVAGPSWVGEVVGNAWTLCDWIDDSEEYDLDRLSDMTHQLADSEVEDYYSNINKRVQELSLWAFNELDEEVESLNSGTGFLTITDLNTQYLYCAMRGLYYTLADWALDNAEELEEEAVA